MSLTAAPISSKHDIRSLYKSRVGRERLAPIPDNSAMKRRVRFKDMNAAMLLQTKRRARAKAVELVL